MAIGCIRICWRNWRAPTGAKHARPTLIPTWNMVFLDAGETAEEHGSNNIMVTQIATTVAGMILFVVSGLPGHAQTPWNFRGLRTDLKRSYLDSIIAAPGSPWIFGIASIDRRTGKESPTIMSVGRMRISGVFCLDSFAVVLRHRDDRHSLCAFFTSITLDYTDEILSGFQIDLDVEGTISTDTLVRLLIDEFSNGLPPPTLSQSEDGSIDYSGKIVNNARTYAQWERDGMDIRLIDTRPSLALRVRRVER